MTSGAMDSKHTLTIIILSVFGVVVLLFLGFEVFDGLDKTPSYVNQLKDVARPIFYKESPSRLPNKDILAIYEYGDFACFGCQTMAPAIAKIVEDYKGKVNLVWKDFPFLTPQSTNAAIAARCADAQNKFWEYHDWLFEHNDSLEAEALLQGVRLLRLDESQFTKCLDNKDIAGLVSRDFYEGQVLGVNETPTFIIGDVALVGLITYEELEQIVVQELNKT